MNQVERAIGRFILLWLLYLFVALSNDVAILLCVPSIVFSMHFLRLLPFFSFFLKKKYTFYLRSNENDIEQLINVFVHSMLLSHTFAISIKQTFWSH